jgi:hypothetical protein
MEGIQEKPVKLAIKAGFKEVDKEDFQEVWNFHREKLLNEELIQLDGDRKKKRMKMPNLMKTLQ